MPTFPGSETLSRLRGLGLAAGIAAGIAAILAANELAAAPAGRLHPVPFNQVRIEDAFWAPRLETNRLKTVPHNIRSCEETGRIANFARAGKLEEGKFEGIYFNDSDVYKMLEGASYTLASHPDPELDARLDGIIARIASAQQPDGYLNTYFTLVEPEKRWSDLAAKHELYCAGHLFEAAVAHHRATGKRGLLDVALRLADNIDRTFGPGRKRGIAGHPEIELALVKLHDLTGEKRYLELSRFLVEEHGNKERGKLFGEYCQDHLPIREQSDIVGHAVRAMYLYSGATDLAAITGDPGIIAAMDRIWANVTLKKMYITGGIGSSASNEGFTTDYDLPNGQAYAETCASIGMALWNHRLFLLHRDGRYTDVLERVLYNGLLAGVSLDGEKFFYVNPLASRGRHHRQPWFGCACCPTNIVRFLPSLGGYLYAVAGDEVWVNLYIGSSAEVEVAGEKWTLRQETRYPWSGDVRIAVEPASPRQAAVFLRLPGWCAAPAAAVNGEKISFERPAGGYLEIRRTWRPGDRIELSLPMEIRRVESHPAVKENRGKAALERGPIVYCLEGADHGGRVADLVLERGAALAAEHRPDLLGGVTVLSGRGRRAAPGDWEGRLYRPQPAPGEVEITAIPYYAWDHREPGEMAVWIPEHPAFAEAPLPSNAAGARASASHVWHLDTVAALNDGLLPADSGDHSIPRFTWWDRRGTVEWVEYRFESQRQVSGSEVYWFSDQGGCRPPESWRLLWDDGGGWREVETASRPGVEKDRFNAVSFKPVRTRALRIEARLREGFSSGILEWRL